MLPGKSHLRNAAYEAGLVTKLIEIFYNVQFKYEQANQEIVASHGRRMNDYLMEGEWMTN